MAEKHAWIITVVACCCVGASTARGLADDVQKEPVTFHQVLVDSNKKLYEAGSSYGSALLKATRSGKAEDVQQAKKSLENTLKVFKEVRQHLKSLKIPDSDVARECHKAHFRHFEVQEKTFVKDGPTLIRIVEDNSLGEETKIERIKELIRRNSKLEEQTRRAWEKAEKAFAKHYNITLP